MSSDWNTRTRGSKPKANSRKKVVEPQVDPSPIPPPLPADHPMRVQLEARHAARMAQVHNKA
ncbi:hypothetical protein ABGN05_24960 [Aquibium sp. LZ166]|uniref:Uncharacterized protein n=1 Tax=Aquibium pacificus TaxID=3153579 RepID=A0ABV3SSI3_9HYPH